MGHVDGSELLLTNQNDLPTEVVVMDAILFEDKRTCEGVM